MAVHWSVYKFQIEAAFMTGGDVKMELPPGFEPLHVADQNGVATMWGRVPVFSTSERGIQRTVYVRGTGHPCPSPDEADHIGTIMRDPLVWHFFISRQ